MLSANTTVSSLSGIVRPILACQTLKQRLRCYSDHDTAASAVRNLNGTEVNGRPLRIDLADSDPFFEGKTTKSGRTRPEDDSRPTRFGPVEDKNADPLANLPKGIPIPPGSDALTTITTSLAAVPPAQMLDILGQMKVIHSTPNFLSVAALIGNVMHDLGIRHLITGERQTTIQCAPAAGIRVLPGYGPEQPG